MNNSIALEERNNLYFIKSKKARKSPGTGSSSLSTSSSSSSSHPLKHHQQQQRQQHQSQFQCKNLVITEIYDHIDHNESDDGGQLSFNKKNRYN